MSVTFSIAGTEGVNLSNINACAMLRLMGVAPECYGKLEGEQPALMPFVGTTDSWLTPI